MYNIKLLEITLCVRPNDMQFQFNFHKVWHEQHVERECLSREKTNIVVKQ